MSYQGSEHTAAVRAQIAERWGEEEAARYNPRTNCFTLKEWNRRGYAVIKGETYLESVTYIKPRHAKDDEDEGGGGGHKVPRTVYLFFDLQVHPFKRIREQQQRQELAS